MDKQYPPSRKTGNLESLPKHGIWFAQVVNSLSLKVKYILNLIFAVKISNVFQAG